MNCVSMDRAMWADVLAEAEDCLIGARSTQISINGNIIGNASKRLPTTIPEERGCYAIWVDGVVQYIGKAVKIRSRLRQHLIYRSPKTGSKFNDVMQAHNAGKKISVSFISFDPSQLNEAVEQGLINKLTGGVNNRLPWNSQGCNLNALSDWMKKEFSRTTKPVDALVLATKFDSEFYSFDDFDQVLAQLVTQRFLKKITDASGTVFYQKV